MFIIGGMGGIKLSPPCADLSLLNPSVHCCEAFQGSSLLLWHHAVNTLLWFQQCTICIISGIFSKYNSNHYVLGLHGNTWNTEDIWAICLIYFIDYKIKYIAKLLRTMGLPQSYMNAVELWVWFAGQWF